MERINSKVILAVKETGSFTAAANSLGYTPAGISYIIKSIEKELGFPLFDRTANGVCLSSEGKLLYSDICLLNSTERNISEKIGAIKGLVCGTVRVLVFDSVSVRWLPGILKEFSRDYPGVTVEPITMENSRISEKMVYNHEADCAFFLHFPIISEIESIPLIKEKMKVVVSSNHPLAGNKVFPVSELGKYPYIRMAFAEDTGIDSIFSCRGVFPNVVYNIDNDYTAMSMVEAGLGFCIFPELLLKRIPFQFHILDFDEPVERIVSIGTRSMAACSPATLKFIEYTRQWVLNNG